MSRDQEFYIGIGIIALVTFFIFKFILPLMVYGSLGPGSPQRARREKGPLMAREGFPVTWGWLSSRGLYST